MHEKYSYPIPTSGATAGEAGGTSVRLEQTLKSSLDLIQHQYVVVEQAFSATDAMNKYPPTQMSSSAYIQPEEVEEDDDESDDDDDDSDDDIANYNDEEEIRSRRNSGYLDDGDYLNGNKKNGQDDDDDDDDDETPPDPLNRPVSRLGGNPRHRRHDGDLSDDDMDEYNEDAPSYAQLELATSYLTTQNEKLERELEQSRQTAQALKLIISSKDEALRKKSTEFQQLNLKIRILEAAVSSKHSKSGSIIVRSGASETTMTIPPLDNVMPQRPQSPPPAAASLNVARRQRPQSKKQLSPTPSPRQSVVVVEEPVINQKSLREKPKKLRKKQGKLPRPKIKHQRRWSMDFGPRNRLISDDDDDDDDDDDNSETTSEKNHGNDANNVLSSKNIMVNCRSPSASLGSTLTANTSGGTTLRGSGDDVNTSQKSPHRRRPTFIRSLSCHPLLLGSNKLMDLSPPTTDLSDDDNDDDIEFSEDDDDEDDVRQQPFSRGLIPSHMSKLFSNPLRMFSAR